jgi:hypothetical protein
MMNPASLLLLAVLVGASGACSTRLVKPAKMSERKGTLPAKPINTIAVIASDDQQSTIRMSAGVRGQLTEAGVTAVRRAGRWTGETDAVTEICMPGQEQNVDGVLFVSYNRLTLRACETKLVVYEIDGGNEVGLQDMAKRLIVYLRPPSQ